MSESELRVSLPTPSDFAAFPYPRPYDIQKDLMRCLYSAIEEGKVAIIESPTGTVSIETASSQPTKINNFPGENAQSLMRVLNVALWWPESFENRYSQGAPQQFVRGKRYKYSPLTYTWALSKCFRAQLGFRTDLWSNEEWLDCSGSWVWRISARYKEQGRRKEE